MSWDEYSGTHLESAEPANELTLLLATVLADAMNPGIARMADACPSWEEGTRPEGVSQTPPAAWESAASAFLNLRNSKTKKLRRATAVGRLRWLPLPRPFGSC